MAAALEVVLRDVTESDLPLFFEHQLDPEANRMAAFAAKDPTDRAAFDEKWARIIVDDSITIRTILVDREVVGHVLQHSAFGKPEISYWIAKEHWGKGIATRALAAFLQVLSTRPLYAHVAYDNFGSMRVLEKCGFTNCGLERGFANAREQEIDEHVFELK